MDLKCFLLVLILAPCLICSEVKGQTLDQEVKTEIVGEAVIMTQMRLRVSGSRVGNQAYEERVIANPAGSARVELVSPEGETFTATADRNGSFSIKGLSPGPVSFTIQYPPLRQVSGSFELLPGDNIALVSFFIDPRNPPSILIQDEGSLIYQAPFISRSSEVDAIGRLLNFPGVVIVDGQLIVTGQKVQSTCLDGALILGILPDE